MNGIALTLDALRDGERRLALDLASAADRHRAEHEVHHVATVLAQWSEEHCRRLAEAARAHGTPPAEGPVTGSVPTGPPPTPLPRTAGAAGDPPDPGLLLLADLRALHLGAAGNSLHWEMLTQAAHATRDRPLLELTSFCHPRTLRQMRWTESMVENLSAQLLTSV
ncbi:hypothetical protein ACWGK1_36510 [Streptomyces wedmorensis]